MTALSPPQGRGFAQRHKELVHVVVEADKVHNTKMVSWRTTSANGQVPLHVQTSKNRRAAGMVLVLRPRKNLFESKSRKKIMSPY
jgi:hypothetical protein